jgi:transposase
MEVSKMPSPYSIDLRERAVAAYHNGEDTQEEIAETFAISLSSLRCYLRLEKEGSDLAPKIHYQRGPHQVIDKEGLQTVMELVQQFPDATLAELCASYRKCHRKKVSQSMMHRALKKLNLRRKKKSLYAKEQEREEVKKSVKNIRMPC